MRVILVKHAETQWNNAAMIQGVLAMAQDEFFSSIHENYVFDNTLIPGICLCHNFFRINFTVLFLSTVEI